MRPYVTAGVGAVYGIFINSDVSTKQLRDSTDFKATQFAPTATLGLGADFGKPGTTGYGIGIKYQLLRFKNHLGARTNFDNLQIGFHVNF
jgi:hypothetical protein